MGPKLTSEEKVYRLHMYSEKQSECDLFYHNRNGTVDVTEGKLHLLRTSSCCGDFTRDARAVAFYSASHSQGLRQTFQIALWSATHAYTLTYVQKHTHTVGDGFRGQPGMLMKIFDNNANISNRKLTHDNSRLESNCVTDVHSDRSFRSKSNQSFQLLKVYWSYRSSQKAVPFRKPSQAWSGYAP